MARSNHTKKRQVQPKASGNHQRTAKKHDGHKAGSNVQLTAAQRREMERLLRNPEIRHAITGGRNDVDAEECFLPFLLLMGLWGGRRAMRRRGGFGGFGGGMPGFGGGGAGGYGAGAGAGGAGGYGAGAGAGGAAPGFGGGLFGGGLNRFFGGGMPGFGGGAGGYGQGAGAGGYGAGAGRPGMGGFGGGFPFMF